MFDFAPYQFRCFYKPSPVRIAPITILLGENSTGKTSFLAALRLLTELFTTSEEPDFNKPPFNLGAYDQIAHFRGGKYGRAKDFCFSVYREAHENLISEAEKYYRKPLFRSEGIETSVKFVKKNAQPALSEVSIVFGPISLELKFQSNEERFRLRTPKGTTTFSQNELLKKSRVSMNGARDLRFLGTTIRNLFQPTYRLEKGKAIPERIRDEEEVHILARLVTGAVESFRRNEVKLFAPIRTKPQRTYDPKAETPDPEGEYIPYLLARLAAEKNSVWSNLKSRLEAFGTASGLFEEIDVKRKGGADSDPFQLFFTLRNQTSNLVDVGYGVSQIIPLLTEMILSTRPTVHLIQQPEVHLHPRAQAEFASLVKELFAGKASYCILETHSDFIVDRLRYHIGKGETLKKEDVSIIFFARHDHEVTPFQIELDDLGNLVGVPFGYRDFFKREKFRALGLDDDVLDS